MSVHVDELHTQIMPSTGAEQTDQKSQQPLRPGAAQAAWAQQQALHQRDQRRTAAQGFDD